MTQDEALQVLLKLVDGDKSRCLELVQTIRQTFPGKSMQWCIEKAIYDIRFEKKPLIPTLKQGHLPPPPPPNPTLSKPKVNQWGVSGVVITSTPEKPLAVSTQDLRALLETKKSMPLQASSEASRRKLFQLLNGDIDQARRIVNRIRIANPDRSEQWAVDKALYDLARDRF